MSKDLLAELQKSLADARPAVRHPKRGKAHRLTVDAYASTLYPDHTVCGRWTRDMTERIPLGRTAPEDRCKRCWPDAGVA